MTKLGATPKPGRLGTRSTRCRARRRSGFRFPTCSYTRDNVTGHRFGHLRHRGVRAPQRDGHRRAGRRTGRHPPRGRGLAGGARRCLHSSHHRVPALARCGCASAHRVQSLPDRLAVRHRGAGVRQERREHGDRPQRQPRAVGLDEQPGDPLEHVGVGHGGGVLALAVLPQLPASRVQQRRRRRRRSRFRCHASDPGRAVETRAPGAATPKCVVGSYFRMGDRAARCAFRAGPRRGRQRGARRGAHGVDPQDRPPADAGAGPSPRTAQPICCATCGPTS